MVSGDSLITILKWVFQLYIILFHLKNKKVSSLYYLLFSKSIAAWWYQKYNYTY